MAKKPCGTWTITDIPADKVAETMADFKVQKPKSLKKTEQDDGKWTVTAVFPDCTDGRPDSTERSHDD